MKFWILLTELNVSNKDKWNFQNQNPTLKPTDGSNWCYKFSNNYKIMEFIMIKIRDFSLMKKDKISILTLKRTFKMNWMTKIWPSGTLKKLKITTMETTTITLRSYLKIIKVRFLIPVLEVISTRLQLFPWADILNFPKLPKFRC